MFQALIPVAHIYQRADPCDPSAGNIQPELWKERGIIKKISYQLN
jgi:hypothetical protein